MSEEMLSNEIVPEEVIETAGATNATETAETAEATEATGTAEILPEKTESMEDYAEELNASFKKVREGDMLTGTVVGVSETEVFLDLKYYTQGIIRIEDLSNDPGFSIKADIKVGDELSATVLRADDGKGNILLSLKEATDVLAWDKLKELLKNETTITVKIAGIVNAGVVAYAEGIRGFIPASKLSLNYVEDLNEWLHKEIQVRVITADAENQKLVLSAREILKEKANAERANKVSNIEIGLVTEGTVESLQPYGAFINLGNGLSGLVHISQICEKRIKTPAAVLKVGDTVKVKVIALKEGKISLSMKALEEASSVEISEESFDLPETEEVTTTLGDLFKNLKF